MTKWIEVPTEEVDPSKVYFLTQRPPTPLAPRLFLSRGLDGKQRWATKPGIAIRIMGTEPLRKALQSDTNLAAVLVPADADKRWRARRARTPRKRKQPPC